MSGDMQKTFYLETFGCQMNVHDSEKVIGTLVQQGYRLRGGVDAEDGRRRVTRDQVNQEEDDDRHPDGHRYEQQ